MKNTQNVVDRCFREKIQNQMAKTIRRYFYFGRCDWSVVSKTKTFIFLTEHTNFNLAKRLGVRVQISVYLHPFNLGG